MSARRQVGIIVTGATQPSGRGSKTGHQSLSWLSVFKFFMRSFFKCFLASSITIKTHSVVVWSGIFLIITTSPTHNPSFLTNRSSGQSAELLPALWQGIKNWTPIVVYAHSHLKTGITRRSSGRRKSTAAAYLGVISNSPVYFYFFWIAWNYIPNQFLKIFFDV